MICPSCQHENPPDAGYCGDCGDSLAVEQTCPSCERPNPADQRFCHGCGQPLAADTVDRDPREYTPKHLADKILQSKSALEGERKQVTVLFADVKGSMELAERLGPETWHRVLDRFFEILAEGVHRFEGTTNQYLGDGIMALFGAPIAHEDHAQRACYAALRIRDRLREFTEEIRAEHRVELQTRIGLNSGDVVVGKIGDDLRMDYTAQGQTVGLASRVEQIAEAGEVYVTEHTARLVHGFFNLEDLGAKELPGVSEAVRVHTLKGVGGLHTRLELAQTRGLSAFVGRDREFGVLEGGLEQALAGNGQIVGVVGEAGVGKSRLCLEFVRACRDRGVSVVEAHCPPHGKTEPFGAILQLLRAAFGLREGERDAAARDRVTVRLAELDTAFEQSLPLVFDFLGMLDPDRDATRMDAQVREQRLHRFVGQLVQARSRQEPAVVFLDDTHWIDDLSDRSLATIATAVSGTRTLLLVNFRPEYSADWMSGSDYSQLPIRALGPGDAETLLRALLGGDAVNAALFERILRETGGNPFFLEEVVQSLAESGALQGERGAYRLVESVESISIPATVQAVLAARIDRLSERDKHVLQTASVIGREVPEALLARVAAIPKAELDQALERLRRSEFLHEAALFPDVVHEFKHPLTREVAYESQLSDLRSRTHAAVAQALEELHGERIDAHAALVAYHQTHAARPIEAARWYHRAYRHSWLKVSHSEAQRYCYEALDLLEGAKSEWGENGARLFLEICTRTFGCGWSLGLARPEADSLLERAREAASRLSDAERDKRIVPVLEMYAHVAMQWDPGVGIQHLREALDLAERCWSEAEQIEIRRALVHGLFQGGRYREAWELVESVIANPPSDPLSVCEWMTGAGVIPFPGLLRQGALALSFLGRPREALDHLEYALSLVRGGHRVPLEDVTLTDEEIVVEDYYQPLGFAVMSYALLGDAERASKCLSSWVSNPGAFWLDSTVLQASGSIMRALALQQLGDWSELATTAGRALDLQREANLPHWLALSLVAQAQARLGDHRHAIENGSTVLEGCGADLGALHTAARALLRSGGAEQAERVAPALDTMEKVIAWTGAAAFSPLLHEVRAQLARVCGDEATCERERAQAERLWTEMGAPGHIERMPRDLEELRSR